MRGFTNLLFWFFTSPTFFTTISASADTLTATQILTTNQTLLSKNETFVLGFFTGNNSNWYLGIWFKFTADKTPVWVANRDNPLHNSTGFLKINGDSGNMVLVNDPSGNPIWSSNQTAAKNPVLQLLDSGNLIVREVNDSDPTKYLWQSFDYPTDTLLPGMKVGWNLDTGIEKHLTSWKITGQDPSSGYYFFKVDYHGLPEIFIFNNQQKVYRTGPWIGDRFSGTPEMKSYTDFIKFTFTADQHEVSYSIGNPSFFSKLSLTSNGKLKRLITFEGQHEVSYSIWTPFWSIPEDLCDYYRECGPYGICDSNASPVCVCMRGFRPKNQQAWNLRDGSDGCVRNTDLECGSDKFLQLQNVKLPDTRKVFVNRSMTLVECGDLCHGNCSCTGYANIEITNGGSGCVMWIGELIDMMRQYAEGGQDLYVRLAASDVGNAENHTDKNKNKSKRPSIALIVAIGTVTLAICAFLAICAYRLRKRTAKRSEIQSQRVLGVPKRVKLDELPLYDFEVVATATDNFHITNMLGKGGFGPVYKGLLPDGQEIAVKRLSRASKQGLEEFMNEVVVISKLQHRNLVRIIGCCIEGDEKMLIYEFMPNKSLDAFIFDPLQRKHLDWAKRSNIIDGIARGLNYLHRDSRLRIIHRDLKASNILLDEEMNPKISDFGLARIYKGEDEVNTRRIAGTYGYMSPEYAMEGLFLEKSDIYSFGVLLLEIVSGKRNTSFRNDKQPLSLIGFAWKLWNEDNIRSLIDPEISASGFENQILRCIHIAFLCVQEVAKERPTMTTVVLMLNSEISHLPPPRHIAFVQKQNSSSLVSSPQSQEIQLNSNNIVTLTEMQPR